MKVRQHIENARHRQGRIHIDPFDPALGDRAVHHDAAGEIGSRMFCSVPSVARHLGGAVDACERRPNGHPTRSGRSKRLLIAVNSGHARAPKSAAPRARAASSPVLEVMPARAISSARWIARRAMGILKALLPTPS